MTLPVVKEETGIDLQEELMNSENNDFVTKMLKRLQSENPCVANFISMMSLSSKDTEAVCYTALLVYRLLEKELEKSEQWPDLVAN